ncbi:hypothetical protein [Candidatus Nitrosotenuis uzonensis]|uniref:Uncharacterized protein n=1 Tax=Candidatus Nitrosotenuis uzonensis TaxID=1407055 RepID=V6AV01_9ARCH|nr:hypothetical protein [Candidatus Nitrosotenuis uzonensis]CDI06347.1 hypothetical protein NITUZ_40513 [Candidatus Nitrosotenuis uzonensis]
MTEWENVVIELVALAGIIFGAVYVEHWNYLRMQKKTDKATRKKMLLLIKEDLIRKIRFIDDSIQHHDYKPFFTSVWDSVILSGKQTLLEFDLIQNLEHTYSSMKYYNTELQQKGTAGNEQTIKELLVEIRKTVDSSLKIL